MCNIFTVSGAKCCHRSGRLVSEHDPQGRALALVAASPARCQPPGLACGGVCPRVDLGSCTGTTASAGGMPGAAAPSRRRCCRGSSRGGCYCGRCCCQSWLRCCRCPGAVACAAGSTSLFPDSGAGSRMECSRKSKTRTEGGTSHSDFLSRSKMGEFGLGSMSYFPVGRLDPNSRAFGTGVTPAVSGKGRSLRCAELSASLPGLPCLALCSPYLSTSTRGRAAVRKGTAAGGVG
mmetsp:Transcript_27328/g.70939  ORF Transcript_27328/g.70939 Transcript_27328/m.70939 type:complete len:234 (+) Transcript_27328:1248-1949(+)